MINVSKPKANFILLQTGQKLYIQNAIMIASVQQTQRLIGIKK